MVNYYNFDLNLLRVFDTMIKECSVVRTGQRLNLSQSAVSHALRRLRYSFEDDLFVRTGKGMQPTTRAIEISKPLRQAILHIETTLGVLPFDPANDSREFVVAANDYLTALIIPKLIGYLDKSAPKVDLIIRPSTRIDLAEQIDVGRIDVGLGVFEQIPSRFQSRLIYSQNEVIISGNLHPICSKPKLLIQELCNYPLAIISLGGQEEGAINGFIMERGLARQSDLFNRTALENALAKENLNIRTRITLPHFLALPMILDQSDMLAIVPKSFVQIYGGSRNFTTHQLPYPSKKMSVRAIWHKRNDNDPANIWLREAIMVASKDFL